MKYITTHRRPPTVQSLILIQRRGRSGQIASLPLFWVSFFYLSFLLRDADMHSAYTLSKDGWLDGMLSVTRRYCV